MRMDWPERVSHSFAKYVVVKSILKMSSEMVVLNNTSVPLNACIDHIYIHNFSSTLSDEIVQQHQVMTEASIHSHYRPFDIPIFESI